MGVKPEQVKISLNATTGEYSITAGNKASLDTQEAVMNAILAKMSDVGTDDKGLDSKKMIEDQAKVQDALNKASKEAHETQMKAKKLIDAGKEEAKKNEDLGKKKI